MSTNIKVWGVDDTTTTGAADQIIESGGPTTLAIDAIADGEYLRRVGATIVGDTLAGAIPTGEKGASLGVATLDASTFVVEAAQVLRVTGQSLTAGACTDGQFLTRSGTTYAGVTHGGTGNPHTQYLLRTERTYHVLTAQTETTTAGAGAAIAGWGSLSLGVGELIRYSIIGTYQSAGAAAAQFRLDSLSLAPLQVVGLWTVATDTTSGTSTTTAVNGVNVTTTNNVAPAVADTSYPFSATGFIRGDTLTGTFRFRIATSSGGTAVRVMPNSILILERTLL